METLWRHTRHFKKRMSELGFDIGRSESPITPIMVGEAEVAKKLSARLFEEGVFALPIVFPMVAKGKARIRTIMNAALTEQGPGLCDRRLREDEAEGELGARREPVRGGTPSSGHRLGLDELP